MFVASKLLFIKLYYLIRLKTGFIKLLIINNIQIAIFPLKPKGRSFKTNDPFL